MSSIPIVSQREQDAEVALYNSEEARIAQTQFDDKYISSDEICRTLGISRSGLSQARRRGKLPEAITLCRGQIFIWLRATVAPILASWANSKR